MCREFFDTVVITLPTPFIEMADIHMFNNLQVHSTNQATQLY